MIKVVHVFQSIIRDNHSLLQESAATFGKELELAAIYLSGSGRHVKRMNFKMRFHTLPPFITI